MNSFEFEEILANKEFEEALRGKSIEEQIEALTQELRPFPNKPFYYFEASEVQQTYPYIKSDVSFYQVIWRDALFASTNKAEVEEYADCYRRLKLYQLLGKKAEKEYPLKFDRRFSMVANYEDYKGTDFFCGDATTGLVVTINNPRCALGGVWFSREEDRLEALKLAGITREFQERCAKYGLGGA